MCEGVFFAPDDGLDTRGFFAGAEGFVTDLVFALGEDRSGFREGGGVLAFAGVFDFEAVFVFGGALAAFARVGRAAGFPAEPLVLLTGLVDALEGFVAAAFAGVLEDFAGFTAGFGPFFADFLAAGGADFFASVGRLVGAGFFAVGVPFLPTVFFVAFLAIRLSPVGSPSLNRNDPI